MREKWSIRCVDPGGEEFIYRFRERERRGMLSDARSIGGRGRFHVSTVSEQGLVRFYGL